MLSVIQMKIPQKANLLHNIYLDVISAIETTVNQLPKRTNILLDRITQIPPGIYKRRFS